MGKKHSKIPVGVPVEKQAETTVETPGGPGWCKYCNHHIPLGKYEKFSTALLKHQWEAHRPEMLTRGKKGNAASVAAKKKKKEEAAKTAPPSAPEGKPVGDGQKKDGLKEGGDMTSIRQPAHGAIQFIMGEQKIMIDPSELYDAFMYYRDMVAHHNIHEPFTKVIKTSVKYIWELLNRQQAQEQPAGITPKIGDKKDLFQETLNLANQAARLRIIEGIG